jgi:phage tail tape-measure protein
MKRKNIAMVPEQIRNQHKKRKLGQTSIEALFAKIEKEVKEACKD